MSRSFASLLGTATLSAALLVGGNASAQHGGGHGGGHGGAYHGGAYHGGAYHGGYPHAGYNHGGYYHGGHYGPYHPYGYGAYHPYYGHGYYGYPGYGFYRPYYGYGGLGLGGLGLGGLGLGGLGLGTLGLGGLGGLGLGGTGVAYGAALPLYGYGGYGSGAGYGLPPVAMNTPGGAAVPPAVPGQTPPPDNAAHLQLVVPQNAEVLFDGDRTSQTGPVREFVSPPLTAGRAFAYKITVRYTDASGRLKDDTRRINVRANDWFRIDFNQPAPPETPAPEPIPQP